jgi:hypothetical protein
MQKLIPFFITGLFFISAFQTSSFSQCAEDESYVQLIVHTDDWAYELYWELVPVGQFCGEAEVLMSGGNEGVGCDFNGGGASEGENYANNTSYPTASVCVTTGSQLDVIFVDSYGDGGTDFTVLINGAQTAYFEGTGYGNTFTLDVSTDVLIEHDNSCDALEVAVDGTPSLISSVGATSGYFEVAPPTLGCNTPGGWCEGGATVSVWATFTVEESVHYQARLCNENTTFDTQIALWIADDCGNWDTYELIGANDDAGCAVGSNYASIAYTPCLEPGTQVLVQIDGWYGATGEAEITVAPSTLEPYITSASYDISCALETEFNPDGSIMIYTYNTGLDWSATWTGPFGYTGTGTTITGLLPGTYNVEMSSGCSGETFSASYEIVNPELLELSSVVSSSCADGSSGGIDLTITGGTGGYDIDWSGPEGFDFDSEDLLVAESGWYNVQVIDAEGCSEQLDIEIPYMGIVPFSLGPDMEMCAGDMNIFFGPGGDYSYEWQDGSTAQLYILQTEPGLATTAVVGVSVSNNDGCQSSDAIVVTVMNCAAIDDISGTKEWTIYPNPISHVATFNFEGVKENSTCIVRDASGRMVTSFAALPMTTFEASDYESGIYMLEVVDGNGVSVWHSRAVIQ